MCRQESFHGVIDTRPCRRAVQSCAAVGHGRRPQPGDNHFPVRSNGVTIATALLGVAKSNLRVIGAYTSKFSITRRRQAADSSSVGHKINAGEHDDHGIDFYHRHRDSALNKCTLALYGVAPDSGWTAIRY